MLTGIDCSLALSAPTVSPGRSTVEGDFLALVYGDQDLLRAEFDAIIGVAWDDPPPRWPTPRPTVPWPAQPLGRSRRGTVGLPGPATQPHRPGIGGWARQRSPPLGPLPDTLDPV
jgi:hypothetical protein